MSKKLTLTAALKRIKQLEEAFNASNTHYTAALIRAQAAEAKLKERIDDRMLTERRQLVQALSGMTEAVSHAIRMTVGKEVL